MKISLEITNDQLMLINRLWILNENQNSREQKASLSVLQFAAERFLKKSFSRLGKKKPFKITLWVFEANAIERHLRVKAYQSFPTDSYELNTVISFCNQLNQQLA